MRDEDTIEDARPTEIDAGRAEERTEAGGTGTGADPVRGPEPGKRELSRRDLLRAAGAAGAAALLPKGLTADGGGDIGPSETASDSRASDSADAAAPGGSASQAGPPSGPSGPLVNLSARETAVLTAMVDRLIPSDDLGPGAVESGALIFIDRALTASPDDREAYRDGLAALDRYSRYSREGAFVDLPPTVQDSILLDLQTGGATGARAGFEGSSGSFFNMVKGHVWQAMFGDPHYGGNAGFAGWDLVAYPGVRIGISARDQARLEAGELEPVRRSAYDYPVFG